MNPRIPLANNTDSEQHHVELAFEKHAKECKCTAFAMARMDKLPPGATLLEKFEKPEIVIRGTYTWSERKFEFTACAHRPPFVGNVLIEAFPMFEALKVDTMKSVCDLVEHFYGYGLILPNMDLVDPTKSAFMGIRLFVNDHNFDDLTVNGISLAMHSRLRGFELEHGINTKL